MEVTHRTSRWPTRGLLLLLTCNLLLLLYYVVVDYGQVVHSDAAVTNLLAQEIHDSGRFFPPDWNYANGDLWIWATHLPVLALLPWLPNSYALHAVASAVTAALVLLGAWSLGGVLGQSRLARLACLALLAGGLSANMAENLYGQAAYGVLFYLSCFICCCGWHLLHARGAARWRWAVPLALLVLLVFWSNPARAMVYYGLPLLLAALALRLAPAPGAAPGAAPAGRTALLLALVAAALLAGVLLHAHTARLVGKSGLAPAVWLGLDGMLRNAVGTLRGLLSLFGGLPPEGAPLISAGGLAAALRLGAALVLLALLPWALRRACRAPLRRGRLFVAVFALSALAVNLFVLLCTSLPDMAAPEASIRYLVPPLLCALLLLAGMLIDDGQRLTPRRGAGLLALLVVAANGLAAYRVEQSPGYFPRAGGRAANPHAQLADYLQQQGLRYGYASFWHAGRLTLLSAQQLRVRQIDLANGLPVPLRHLSSDRWYRAEAWQGETFLLQTEDEARATDWTQMARYAGQPARTLRHAGWRITVYPDNLAATLPLWDYRRPTALRLPIGPATPHRVGHLVEQDGALRAEAGESGHLHFGPKRPTAPGRYLAGFDLVAEGAGVDDFGLVDVAAGGGAAVLAARAIKGGGPLRVTLPFSLDRPVGDLELRVWSNGAGRLTLRGVTLTALEPR